MAKLRECLTKIDGFTKSAKDKLLAAFDRYKGQGMSDLQAGTEAIVDSYMDLNKDLNDLKTKASVPTKDGVRPEVKVEKKAAPEPKEAPKQTPKESMKAYSIEGLYQVNKRLFNLPNDQAKAAAIVMDKMIQTMAKREGISPIEMYNRLKFEKATKEELEKMPQGVKLQVDAWHGSPYQFDKFTTEKIGTGEGAQAFGWGLYFTDLESIARNYAEKLAKQKMKIVTDGRTINVEKDDLTNAEEIAYVTLEQDYDVEKAIKRLEYNQSKRPNPDNLIAIDILKRTKVEGNRSLYKVSLHKGKTPAEYDWLEWDKKIDVDLVKKILPKLTKEQKEQSFYYGLTGISTNGDFYNKLSQSLGGKFKDGQKKASLLLLENGIDGVKYPAESISRGATSDTARGFNYVVFDENAVSIEEVIKFQKDANDAHGAVMVNMDGTAIIYALTDPNVSTPLHELAHVFEHYLSDSERAAVQEWAGTKDWTTQTSEKFARGFEKYLATGEAPSTLKKIFDKFRQWLGEIYDGIIGSDIDITLNPQMEAIYAKMLGEGVVEKNVKKDAVKKEQEIPNTWFRGKYVEAQEGMTQDDLNNEILSDSENPAQIAEAYLSSENNQNAKSDVGAGTVEQKVYQFFKDGNKLSEKAFERVNDSNFANVKDTPGYRTYVAKTGGLAEDGPNTKGYGDEITIDDVGNFLKNYPRGLGEYESKFGENMRSKLSGKFTRLTGKRLNPELAKRIVEEWNKFIDAQGLNEYFNPQEEMERESARFDAASKGILYQESSKKKEKEKIELNEREKAIKAIYNKIKDEPDLTKYKYTDLLDAYNYLITTENYSKTKEGKAAKQEFLKRMAINFNEIANDEVKTDPKYSPEKAAKKDISAKDILFKTLSHFTAEFPALKKLSELFDEAFFNKIDEETEIKNTHKKLAEAVIKDRNKRIGIVQRGKESVLNLIGNRNFKYFDFLDKGDGNMITVDEAKKKNLSDAQIAYLKFVREVIASKGQIVTNLKENWNSEMQVVKTDKKFYENFATENAVAAVSSLLGNTWNINNVRIRFTNPFTGKDQDSEYENVEKILIKYGKQGVKQKAKALLLIAKYNRRARIQLKDNVNVDEKAGENVLNVVRHGDYSITQNGKLTSKFDRKRSPSRAYSKDFYSAINEYIGDTMHIKHMQPLVPIVNAIDYLNKNKIFDIDENGNEVIKHAEKKNAAEYIKQWADLHILQRKRETDPSIDSALRFFRYLTSVRTMMFNVPAQAVNIGLGLWNTWRKEDSATVAKGMARMFGKMKYSMALIQKYKAVSTDVDSNPIRTAGGFLAGLGYAGTKWGEFLVQGSQFLGMMDDKDFNSFEFKKNEFGVEELVEKNTVKDKDQLKKRIRGLINKVSDVQGKYGEKDRRNIMNYEWGKSIMQFKVWMPDYWRIRFSKDAGSWRNMFEGSLDEMRKQISEKGVVKAFWNDKNFMSNLKELSTIVFLMSLIYMDDDDEEKSATSAVAQRALSDVMFVFDPNNAKFTVSRPVASVDVLLRFIDAADHLIMTEADDFYKGDSKYGKKGDPKIIGDVKGFIPGMRTIEMVEAMNKDKKK